jgi:transcription elongation GreA/GreB family factor
MLMRLPQLLPFSQTQEFIEQIQQAAIFNSEKTGYIDKCRITDLSVSKIKMKDELYKNCESYIEEKIARISNSILDLEVALTNESKSSAGDKFETGREMINIEIQKLASQLQQFQQLQVTLEVAKRNNNPTPIRLGSLVETTNATYFICIPIGEVILGDKKLYVIGASSPVAQALLGKAEGDTFSFNSVESNITSVT